MRQVLLFILAGTAGCASWVRPHQPTPTSDTFDSPLRGGGLEAAELDRLVEKRAPIDLGCETSELSVKDLGGRTVAVLGCDVRAVYIYFPEDAVWTLDSITKPSV